MLFRLTELAAKESPDIALFAGDLFDSNTPHTETAQLLRQTLNALDIPVFIAPGNHDPYHPGCIWDRLNFSENVHVFRDENLSCVTLPGYTTRVWGCAFCKDNRPSPLRDFHIPNRYDTELQIAVMHADAENTNSPYAPVTTSEIAASGLDYIAMGHLHSASGIRNAGGTYYAWPGCSEGRGFDETGEKGAYILELTANATGAPHCKATFHPLATRRYTIQTVDLTDTEDVYGSICAALPQGTEGDIIRLVLTGSTAFAPDISALHSALGDRFFSLDLRDNTSLPVSLWSDIDTDTLRGQFLKRLYSQYTTAAEPERKTIVQAARLGLRAMENGEEVPL